MTTKSTEIREMIKHFALVRRLTKDDEDYLKILTALNERLDEIEKRPPLTKVQRLLLSGRYTQEELYKAAAEDSGLAVSLANGIQPD